MKKSFLLFGSKEVTVESILALIEQKTGLVFAEHDSSYRGGIYFRADCENGESIVVQNNLEMDDELAEDQFPNHSVLIYVDHTFQPEYWKDSFESIEIEVNLLRQEEFDQGNP